MGVQPGHIMHQVLYPATISSHLPAEQYADVLLHPNGRRLHIQLLDVIQCHLRMQTNIFLLEPNKAGWWHLPEQVRRLVRERFDQYRHRHRYWDLATAGAEGAATAEATEDCANDRVRAWRIVRIQPSACLLYSANRIQYMHHFDPTLAVALCDIKGNGHQLGEPSSSNLVECGDQHRHPLLVPTNAESLRLAHFPSLLQHAPRLLLLTWSRTPTYIK